MEESYILNIPNERNLRSLYIDRPSTYVVDRFYVGTRPTSGYLKSNSFYISILYAISYPENVLR